MADILLESEQDSKPVNYKSLKHYNDKLTTQNDAKYLAKDKIGYGLSLNESGLLSATGGGSSDYTLPVASTETLGGVKIDGTTITADENGVISASGGGSSEYTLPVASQTQLGGVKTGSNITNSSGTISLTKANVTSALGYTPPTTNTTYRAATTSVLGLVKSGGNITVSSTGAVTVNSVNGKTVGVSVPADAKFTDTTYSNATASTAGLMSAADKSKLDGIGTDGYQCPYYIQSGRVYTSTKYDKYNNLVSDTTITFPVKYKSSPIVIVYPNSSTTRACSH